MFKKPAFLTAILRLFFKSREGSAPALPSSKEISSAPDSEHFAWPTDPFKHQPNPRPYFRRNGTVYATSLLRSRAWRSRYRPHQGQAETLRNIAKGRPEKNHA